MWLWRDKLFLRPDALLLLPLLIVRRQLLGGFLLASAAHELGHLCLLGLFRVPVKVICITAFGAEIHAPLLALSYPQEILTALTGPAVNLLLAVIAARWREGYLFAGINLLLGLLNLLPLPALDGGRALRLLLCACWDPLRGEQLSRILGQLLSLALVAAAAALWRESGGNLLFPLALGGLLLPNLPLVKRRGNR